VAYFADKANLSAGYFGDLIKKETGSTPKDLISLHIIGLAKHRLVSTRDDVSLIAYDLGFEYPAHFSRMFKRLVGQSPSQFRDDR
jgi:AraC-like DNA-binding protein